MSLMINPILRFLFLLTDASPNCTFSVMTFMFSIMLGIWFPNREMVRKVSSLDLRRSQIQSVLCYFLKNVSECILFLLALVLVSMVSDI